MHMNVGQTLQLQSRCSLVMACKLHVEYAKLQWIDLHRHCQFWYFTDTHSASHGLTVGKMTCWSLQGYGEKGIGEIPGGATLELDVELLSVKTSPFGSRVKIVEG